MVVVPGLWHCFTLLFHNSGGVFNSRGRIYTAVTVSPCFGVQQEVLTLLLTLPPPPTSLPPPGSCPHYTASLAKHVLARNAPMYDAFKCFYGYHVLLPVRVLGCIHSLYVLWLCVYVCVYSTIRYLPLTDTRVGG